MAAHAASPGFSQVSHDELVAQVIRLGDELQQVRLDNATLTAQVQQLQQAPQGKGGGNGGGHKSELRNLKGLYPSKFNPANDTFKTWAEDFVRWIKAESEDLATALERSATRTDEIPMVSGSDARFKPDVRFAWLHMKRLMGDKEASDIVRTTADDNALEAFRLLTVRYAAKSNKVRSKKLRAITNF